MKQSKVVHGIKYVTILFLFGEFIFVHSLNLQFLYLEAAFYLPEELTNICDILVEKELRIHITYEELLVLRED